jgi:integrase
LALRRALDRAGLPRIRIHDLRHTAASALLADGIHPKVVQEFLGHSSIKVTLDVYSHVMPTMHAEAMRRLDLILGGDDPADDTDGVEPSAA